MHAITQKNLHNLTNQNRCQTILLAIITLVVLTTVVVSAVTLALVNKYSMQNGMNELATATEKPMSSVASTVTPPTIGPKNTTHLSDRIHVDDLMSHLQQLQLIADRNQKTRALGTSGFEATVDYIETMLRSKTNFEIFREQFNVLTSVSTQTVLTSIIDGVEKSYINKVDFQKAFFSATANFTTPIRLTLINNYGCDEDDWQNTQPYPVVDSIALLTDNENCSMDHKSILAQKYNTSGLLVYRIEHNSTRLPFIIPARNITYPMMIISNALAVQLIGALLNQSITNVTVRMVIPPAETVTVPIPTENLCVDTPTGNKSRTIVIGSHSDSVVNGSGINDNGSGAMGTLVLALTLAELFQRSSYAKYHYRIRFCWWAAEENGMRGSYHHLVEANETTLEGNRLQDYILMLNFDMLASPNYYFGVLESSSLPDIVSSEVKHASMKISKLFRFWFDKEKLPWDNSSLGIQSDHVPFLIAGIPCGGTFSGADTTKTIEQRNRYDGMLGHGRGGIAGVHHDPCYHQACDTIENISPFSYVIMVKAAAYALETLARMPDLHFWLHHD